MSRVNVESKAFSDHRIKLLAKRLGTDRHGALGRLICVWAACTESGAYVLRAEEIDAAADTEGMASAMREVGLAREEASGFYVCGTEGRIEWALSLEERNRKGGQARAAGANRVGGKFVGANQPTSLTPACAGTSLPASDQPRQPASTSAPTPTPALSQSTPEEAYVDPGGPRPSAPENRQEGPKEPSGAIGGTEGPSLAQEAARAKREASRKHVAGLAARWGDWFNRNFDRSIDPAGRGLLLMVEKLVRKHGATYDQMRTVAWHLHGLWMDDPKMAEFLRPSTILAPEKWLARLEDASEKSTPTVTRQEFTPVLPFSLAVPEAK